MQPIKVGVVTTSYPLSADSSSGAFVARFVRALPPWVQPTVITPAATSVELDSRCGREVVVTFDYAPRRWQVLCHQAGGMPATLGQQPWLYALVPILLLAMLRTCLRQGSAVDIYHANWSVNGIVAGIAARIVGKPIVTTLRGSDVNRARNSALYRVLLFACLRLSHRVVSVSETLRDTIMALVPSAPPDHIIVVPNGVDEAFFEIQRNESSSLPLRLVAIGSLTPNKAVDLLLRAVALLPLNMVRLQVIGDGPERSRLIALASALQLGSCVTFTGTVSSERIPAMLSEADVFLSASRSEGRPNAVMEAMAAGVPIVATDIEGIRELMRDRIDGYLVAQGDYSAMATCIQGLIDDRERRVNMGLAARAHIRAKHLTWRATAQRYAELYRSLVRGTDGS